MTKKPDGFFDALAKLPGANATAKEQGTNAGKGWGSGLGPSTGLGASYDNAVSGTYDKARAEAAAGQKQTSGSTQYYGDSDSSSTSPKTGESKGCFVSAVFGTWLVFGIFVAPNVFVWLGGLAAFYILMLIFD